MILKHSALYFVARITGAGLQLCLLIILTHNLDPKSYGVLALFTTAYTFSAVIFFSPWRQALVRFWPEEMPGIERPTNLTQSDFQRTFLLGYLFSIMIFVFVAFIALQTPWLHSSLLIPLIIAAIAMGWTDINLEKYRRCLAPEKYLKLFLIRSGTQLLFMSSGALITQSAMGAIWGLVASHSLAAFLTPISEWRLAFAKATHTFKASIPEYKTWLNYAVPLVMTEFVAAAMIYTDRLMIAARLKIESAGLYSATHDLAWMGLHVISLVAYLAFFPLALKAQERGELQERDLALKQGFTLLFGLSLASTLGLILLSGPVTQLILGEKFHATPPELMKIVAAVHLVYVLKAYWVDLSFSLAKNTWPLLLIGAGSVLINIGLNYILLPVYGLTGAAMATGIASLSAIILAVIFANIISIANYPVNLADLIKIIIATTLMGSLILLMPQTTSLVNLILSVIGGAAGFVASLWVLRLSLISGKYLWKKTAP